jgi:hypothetical protein
MLKRTLGMSAAHVSQLRHAFFGHWSTFCEEHAEAHGSAPGEQARTQALPATGTNGAARMVAPTPDKLVHERSIPGLAFISDLRDSLAVSGDSVNGKGRLSSDDNRPSCRGDQRPTFPNDCLADGLLCQVVGQSIEFQAEHFYMLAVP